MRPSHRFTGPPGSPAADAPRRGPTAPAHLAALAIMGVLLVAASAGRATAQGARSEPAALRALVERRFDALPIRDGVVLRPRTASAIRSIEIASGAIAIDGQPVSGAELRGRLGTDADLVLQLSYLDDAQRRALFGGAPAVSGAAGQPATAPAPVIEPPAPPPPPPPPERRRFRDRRGGDRVRFGGSVTVAEGETVSGDVVVIGGSADVDGEVDGDIVVVGGSLRLGPHANVTQDAVVVGGSLNRDPGARVGGEVQEVGIGAMNLDRLRFPRGPAGNWRWQGMFGSTFSLIATLVRFGVLCLLAALVVLFARGYVDRVGSQAAAEPVKAGAVGLLAQVLFVPLLVVTIVLFVVTIVGIPLLILIPFGILALMVLALAGFTAVSAHVGRWFGERFGLPAYGPIATAVLGVALIVSPIVLARLVGLAGGPLWLMSMGLSILGFLAEYAAWTVGLGAVVLLRFNRSAVPPSGMMTSVGGAPAA